MRLLGAKVMVVAALTVGLAASQSALDPAAARKHEAEQFAREATARARQFAEAYQKDMLSQRVASDDINRAEINREAADGTLAAKVAAFEKDYFKKRAAEWMRWAHEQGFVPAPPQPLPSADGQNRRLEENIDEEFDVLPQVEKEYWLQRAIAEPEPDEEPHGRKLWSLPSANDIAAFQAKYFKDRAKKWAQWGRSKGDAWKDTAKAARAVEDQSTAQFEAMSDEQKQFWANQAEHADAQEGPAHRHLGIFDNVPDFNDLAAWQAKFFRDRARKWAKWGKEKGDVWAPAPDASKPPARRLDAPDERANKYDALADFEQQYWKNYASGWKRWAAGQGSAHEATPGTAGQAGTTGTAGQAGTGAAAPAGTVMPAKDILEHLAAGNDELSPEHMKAETEAWVEWSGRQGLLQPDDLAEHRHLQAEEQATLANRAQLLADFEKNLEKQRADEWASFSASAGKAGQAPQQPAKDEPHRKLRGK